MHLMRGHGVLTSKETRLCRGGSRTTSSGPARPPVAAANPPAALACAHHDGVLLAQKAAGAPGAGAWSLCSSASMPGCLV